MRQKFYTLVTFLFITVYGTAQQTAEDRYEIMLLNAQYDELIKEVNRTNFNKSLSIENKKAEALIRLGRLKEAQQLLDSLNLNMAHAGNALDRVTLESNQGFLYLMQGRNDLSLETLQQASAKFQNSNSLEFAKATTYLGLVYLNTGRIVQAEEQMQATLRTRENYLKTRTSSPKEFEEFLAASYNDLGLVYSHIDKDKALDYYEKALSIYEKLHGKTHPKIAIASTNIGFMYRELELYGDAVNNFETANKIWENVYAGPHFSKAFVFFSLGETYNKMGNIKVARAYYDKALSTYVESYGNKHPDVGRVENAIGNLELAANHYDNAIAHYQNALKANVADFDENNISDNPNHKSFYDGNVLLYSLLYKAQALEARYYGKSLKLKDLTLSLKTLQTCDTLIDKLRQQITNEADKLMLGTIANEVYIDGVRISYELAQVVVKKKTFYELAFYFAEKSKSAVLLEAISDTQAKSFAGIPKELLEEEKNFKSAIALCNQKLAQKPSIDEEQHLREVSFELNRNYQSFIKKLEHQFPQYYNLKFNIHAPAIAEVQQKLEPSTLLLSYFMDDKNDKLYIFQISKTHYAISQISLPKEFDKYITGLRNSLFYNEIQTYVQASAKLSRLLIPSGIPTQISDLVILPTGRLSILPFESLFTGPRKFNTQAAIEKGYQSLPYMLNRFNIRYEFSTGLIFQKAKTQTGKDPSIFLCAPVTFAHNETLSDLPASEFEVKDISNLFAERNFRNRFYTRFEADENLIKSGTLKDYSYLHFATHGLVDETHPELSRIFLQSNVSSEDGTLFAGEIYNLELDANLVTLSACQTGLGKISKGEGVIGLSRALVYAGAKNCMVSFWSVADESTALLMKEFYTLMLSNSMSSMSANLALAKRNIMKKVEYSAPFYWAPFILIGF